MFPLHSANDEVLEHVLLSLWQSLDEVLNSTTSVPKHLPFIPFKTWTAILKLVRHENPNVRIACAHVLQTLFGSNFPPIKFLQSKVLHESEALQEICLHLVSPQDSTSPMETTTFLEILVHLCDDEQFVSLVVASGGVDSFLFLLHHPTYSAEEYIPIQCLALLGLSGILRYRPDAFLESESSCLIEQVFKQLQRVHMSSPIAQAAASFILFAMQSKTWTIRLLIDMGILHWVVHQLSLSHLQLDAVKILYVCLSEKAGNVIAMSTFDFIRTSGSLIHLSWLATSHSMDVVVQATQKLWGRLAQLNKLKNDSALVMDIVEQGCLLLVYQLDWQWLLNDLNNDNLSILLKSAVSSTNSLLQRNIIVSLLFIMARDKVKAHYLVHEEDFLNTLDTILKKSVKSQLNLLRDLYTVCTILSQLPESSNKLLLSSQKTSSCIDAYAKNKHIALSKLEELSPEEVIGILHYASQNNHLSLLNSVVSAHKAHILRLLSTASAMHLPQITFLILSKFIESASSQDLDTAVDALILTIRPMVFFTADSTSPMN